MKKTSFIYLMASAAVAVACLKEDIKEEYTGASETFETLVLSAIVPEFSGDTETRTSLDGLDVNWKKGDKISMVDEAGTVHIYENIAEDGPGASFKTDLVLTEDNKIEGAFQNNSHMIVYPASNIHILTNYAHIVKGVEVPDSQPMVENGIGDECNISYAGLNTQHSYNGDKLVFHNACGLLRLRLRGDAKIKYISITAPSGSVLVGTGSLNYTQGSFINQSWFEFSGTRTVTLEADEDNPFQLTENVTDFYACVVPAESYQVVNDKLTDKLTETNTGAKAGSYRISFTNEKDQTITTSVTLEKDVCAGRISTLGQFNINADSPKWQKVENPPVDKNLGLDYVFDTEELAEIRINVTLEEWNNLLALYDKNSNTDEYIYCDASFTTKGVTHSFKDAGLRLRGNTSRRRPEAGASGSQHNAVNPDWQHCHFMLNLRKFLKDDAHKIGDVRKIHMKWFKGDAAYVREPFCFDVFRRNGIWTSMKTSYCRLWIHVEGDENPAYYGVYTMLEAIDERYLKARKSQFGSDKYNLWKCSNGADLISTEEKRFANDPYAGTANVPYVLKTNVENYNAAKAQLINFISNINTLEGEEYRTWINKVTDVELLLKTYATSVALGNWDDYWCGANNYYMYFNSNDPENYKFFYIPYDFDHSLGIAAGNIDTARQTPLEWYANSQGKTRQLISKLLEFDDYRKLYLDTMHELLSNPELMSEEGSRNRILKWQAMIGAHVSNDTGEDMVMEDFRPSPGYQLLADDDQWNYFRVKAASIPAE